MRFNLDQGNFIEFIEYLKQEIVRRFLSEDVLRSSHSDQYLSVGFSSRGAMVGPVESIVDRTSATLVTFKLSKALVRGIELSKVTKMHILFLESK